MQQILRSKIFISFSIVIALASLIFFLTTSQTYQSEMDILLISKNNAVAKNLQEICNNTKEVINSLRFYDTLSENNRYSTEISLEKTDAQRKDIWQKQIKTQIVKESSVIRILTFNKNEKEADVLSQQVARQISDTMSQYYNIRTELQIRIIDGPVTKANSDFNFLSLILSVLFGIAGGFLAYLVANSFQIVDISKKINQEKNILVNRFNFSKKKENAIEEIIFSEKNPDLTLNYDISTKKAAAPENLPIAESMDLNFEEEAQTSEDEINEILQKAHEVQSSGVREATAEEVKARLNRLLKGEM